LITPDSPSTTTIRAYWPAEAAEKGLYDFYGISHTVRHIVLPRHGIKVRITETGEGDHVVIVPGNAGDGFPGWGQELSAAASVALFRRSTQKGGTKAALSLRPMITLSPPAPASAVA
jgi:hypothetical protein